VEIRRRAERKVGEDLKEAAKRGERTRLAGDYTSENSRDARPSSRGQAQRKRGRHD
jgi:hypothetical protein